MRYTDLITKQLNESVDDLSNELIAEYNGKTIGDIVFSVWTHDQVIQVMWELTFRRMSHQQAFVSYMEQIKAANMVLRKIASSYNTANPILDLMTIQVAKRLDSDISAERRGDSDSVYRNGASELEQELRGGVRLNNISITQTVTPSPEAPNVDWDKIAQFINSQLVAPYTVESKGDGQFAIYHDGQFERDVGSYGQIAGYLAQNGVMKRNAAKLLARAIQAQVGD